MLSEREINYLRMPRWQKPFWRAGQALASIPRGLGNFFAGIGRGIAGVVRSIGAHIADIGTTFKKGDAVTKGSFLVMGLANLCRGQFLRGIMFLLMEVVFIFYMITTGGYWLSMLPSLGLQGPMEEYNLLLDTYVTTYHDNSFKMLLYGVLTIFFIIAFILTWRMNVKQAKISQEMLESRRRLKTSGDDLRSLVDEGFY